MERTEFIKARVTPAEKARAEMIARREGTDTAGLIRRRVFGGAGEQVVGPLDEMDEDAERVPVGGLFGDGDFE